MTEPMSLLPIFKSSCTRLLLVGDPLQLPPTITTNGPKNGLDRTLFDRLAIKQRPIKLTIQYRVDYD